MNRYAIFFVLINLSLAIQLHASEDAQREELKNKIRKIFEGKIKNKENNLNSDIEKKLSNEFKRNFNILFPEEKLNSKEREIASVLKYTCIKSMLKHFDYAQLDKRFMWEVVEDEIKKCMAQVGRVRTELELEKNSISTKVQELQQLLDKAYQLGEFLNVKNAQNFLIKETGYRAMEAVHSRFDCSYLIRENFEKHLSESINNRVGGYIAWLSHLIKDAQKKNNK